MCRPAAPRRGIALLLVLATLVLVMAAAVGLVRTASSERLRRTLAANSAMADDLLQAADAPIDGWLQRHSADVVMPPDALAPQVAVLFDAWSAGDLEHELRITAWDQCGMAGHTVARTGSTLRGAVPPEVLRVLDRVRVERGTRAGLDLFLGHVRPYERVTVFPMPGPGEASAYGKSVPAGAATGGPGPDAPASDDAPPPPALGAWVATHGQGQLNVNTAPLELVEAALRRTGRRGILERIEMSRAAGEPATLADVGDVDDETGRRSRSTSTLELVASSGAWAFRIDVRVGTIRRSWWAVYTLSAESEQPRWECVQRLAITG